MFLAAGDWWVSNVTLYFRHWYSEPGYYSSPRLTINERIPGTYHPYEYNVPLLTVDANETEQFDLGYQTAQITARFQVDTDPPLPLSNPYVNGYYLYNPDGILDKTVSLYSSSSVSNVLEGLVHLHAVPGTYRLTARATVQGSNTTFGLPFEVTVDPGDVVITDPDAPTVVISFPPGNYETCEDCVVVSGTITDESGIESLTIDGTPVTINEPNGYYELTVCDLVTGENPITVEACDIYENCITIVRTVIKLVCNLPPVADASDNIQITSADQAYTVLQGTATDPDADTLQYRWLEGAEVLLDWSPVGLSGEAYLDLGTLPYFSIGNHTLTLEVSDGELTDSDDMILTIQNSPPDVMPAPSSQTVQIGIDPIVVVADAADFDGDTLTYEWRKDGITLEGGVVETVQGGDAVPIPDLYVPAGDPWFPLGVHQIELRVDDGINEAVSVFVSVDVTDTIAPTISPIPNETMLWPADHKMHAITIQANAFDNGGGAITLSVEVISSEPEDGIGDGSTEPDSVIVSVDSETGLIELQLRAERAGSGDGRTYTIVITATDESGNQSVAIVEISAPHDRRKK